MSSPFLKCVLGDVELTNMQLKPEALNALKLPVKVKAGFLGSVKLKVCGHNSPFAPFHGQDFSSFGWDFQFSSTSNPVDAYIHGWNLNFPYE